MLHLLSTPHGKLAQQRSVHIGDAVVAQIRHQIVLQGADVVGVDGLAVASCQCGVHACNGSGSHAGEASGHNRHAMALFEASFQHDVLGGTPGIDQLHLTGGGTQPFAVCLVAYLPCCAAIAAEQHGNAIHDLDVVVVELGHEHLLSMPQ